MGVLCPRFSSKHAPKTNGAQHREATPPPRWIGRVLNTDWGQNTIRPGTTLFSLPCCRFHVHSSKEPIRTSISGSATTAGQQCRNTGPCRQICTSALPQTNIIRWLAMAEVQRSKPGNEERDVEDGPVVRDEARYDSGEMKGGGDRRLAEAASVAISFSLRLSLSHPLSSLSFCLSPTRITAGRYLSAAGGRQHDAATTVPPDNVSVSGCMKARFSKRIFSSVQTM